MVDGVAEFSIHGGIVEEGDGGGVVPDVGEGFAGVGIELVEGKEAAQVGEDEAGVWVALGECEQGGEGGVDLAGEGASCGFGYVEGDGGVGLGGAAQGFCEYGVVVGVALGGRVEFADAEAAGVEGAVEQVERALAAFGVEGGEGGEAARVGGDPGEGPFEGFGAGVVVFPIPALDDGALDAGRVHVAQELIDGRPALEDWAGGRLDAGEPVGFGSRGGPGGGAGGDGGRVEVDVGVGDHRLAAVSRMCWRLWETSSPMDSQWRKRSFL